MRAAQIVTCDRPPVVTEWPEPAAPGPGERLVRFPTSAGMAAGDGSMAELARVPAEDLVELPAGADPVAVAALGLSAVAAYQALTWRGELAAGEQVLVLGAGLAARLAAACDGPVDLVLDPLYGVPAAAAARTLRPGGRLVNLGGSAGETSPLDSSTLRSRSLRVLGYTNNELTRERRAAAVRRVAELAVAGRLGVACEPVPLADAPAAWHRQATGTASGRLVLLPAPA
ncbi:zinc-binding dehydrogenase [Actinomadura sp. ATCC 31491]|uniref:Zinc-binding dehydrogenase n=1 Tax=Actinomadura luzonensis TaxID=2805427 RepID=A0ABT0G825_9ACTN|nr:zinc-binding dehydrogenase [Actinomadura luzonensis]MCK2220261.1 zinc-binding dehydrogenase [Actinomadura luzonensis]